MLSLYSRHLDGGCLKACQTLFAVLLVYLGFVSPSLIQTSQVSCFGRGHCGDRRKENFFKGRKLFLNINSKALDRNKNPTQPVHI